MISQIICSIEASYMRIRNRSRTIAGPEGTQQSFSWSSAQGKWILVSERRGAMNSKSEAMEDVVGNSGGNNPCIHEVITKKGGIVSGQRVRGFVMTRFNQIPSTYIAGTDLGHLIIEGQPSNVEVATEVASRTNPSQPTVSIPVAIAELRDIPRMLQRKVGRMKGNSVLEHNFGYEPMIRDIQSIFNLAYSVEHRKKTLTMLGSGKLSRTRTVFSQSRTVETTGQNLAIHSFNSETCRMNSWTTTTRVSVQGTVNWKPSFDLPSNPDEAHRLLVRIALGLDPKMLISSLYELLPWSWMADYFSNLGDLLSLTNNSIASLAGPVAVSRVTETKLTSGSFTCPPGISVSPLTVTKRSWTRLPTPPGLAFRSSILTAGQMLTLANLANSLGR